MSPREPERARLLRAARAAAAAGWAVVPLWPRSKRPALHGATTCPATGVCRDGHQDVQQRATTDPDVIGWWWSQVPCNVGVACGPSRLVVIDLDTAGGQRPPTEFAGARDGAEVLARLAERAGQPVPATYTVATPSGGRHLYFRAPTTPLRNTTGHIGWRIDTRAHGGLIVAAGSRGADRGTYRVVEDRPVAVLPPWLATAAAPPEPPPRRQHAPAAPAPGQHGRLAAYLAPVLTRVRKATPGHRHRQLLSAAVTVGRLVAGGELTEPQAQAQLEQAAAAHRGIERWTEREAQRTIRDGLRWGEQRPRQLAT